MAGFERLGVMPEIIRAIEDMGWNLQTPVQDEAIPLILGGGDVMIAAETGSGKTGAFSLPMLQIVYETLRARADGKDAPRRGKGKGKGGKKGGRASGGQGRGGDAKASGRPVPKGTRVRLNRADRDARVAVDESGLTCQCRSMGKRDWFGVRANVGVLRGRWCFEATVADEGLARVGWARPNGTRNTGTDAMSFGYGGTGMKSHGGKYEKFGKVFSRDDTIGCLIDRSGPDGSGSISFTHNGTDLGVAFDIPSSFQKSPLFPSIVLKNAEARFAFDRSDMAFAPPKGYRAIGELRGGNGATGPPDSTAGPNDTSMASSVAAPYDGKSPLCLILEPTRELAEQVYREIIKFNKFLKQPQVKPHLFVGGGNFASLVRALAEGVHIAVGTLGTVKSLVQKNKMSLSHCRFFVLDEADQLIRDGGDKDIKKLYSRIQKSDETQVIISSATLHSREIHGLAGAICTRPTWVDLKGKDAVPDTVDHVFVRIDPSKPLSFSNEKTKRQVSTDGVHKRDKGSAQGRPSETVKVNKVLMVKQIIDTFDMTQALIFVRTQLDADNLESFFVKVGGGRRFQGRDRMGGKENRYSCVALHGGKRQTERKEALAAFKEGLVRFCICTDVAARGIDIKELPFVINVTLPSEAEDYIHRVGRVGRADAVGLAVSLCATVKEKVWYYDKRQWRGRELSTALAPKGCCIYYDEPAILAAIRKRLGGVKIPMFNPDAFLKGPGGEFVRKAASYGRTAGSELDEATLRHVQQLRPGLADLEMMQVSAQKNFFTLAQTAKQWASMLKKSKR